MYQSVRAASERAATRAAVTLLCVAAATTGCGQRSEPPEPAAGPADPQLVVYSSLSHERTLSVADAYREATGVTINILVEEAADLIDAMASKAHYPGPDVVLLDGAGPLAAAIDADVLRPVHIEDPDTLLETVPNDPDDYWYPVGAAADAIVYRSDAVDVESLGGYASLGDAQFKDKLCLRRGIHDRSRSLVASMMAALGARDTELAVRGWRANLAASAFDTEAELLAALEEGRCSIGIAGTDQIALHLSDAPGPDLILHFPAVSDGGAMLHPVVAGVARHAGDAEGAVRFVSWLRSPEGQRVLHAGQTEYPVVSGVSASPSLPASMPRAGVPLARVLFAYADAIALIERARYR